MKRLGWFLVVLLAASPAWASNKWAVNEKITVQQLRDLLVSLKQFHKTDAEIASQIKQVDLTEELTAAVKSDLLFASPGPLTSEQICVLEARTSMLVPPPSDLPGLPAPDAAAQKAILDKAIDFAVKNDLQTPHLIALKAVSRYGHLNPFGISEGWGSSVTTGGITLDAGSVSIMSLTSKYTEIVEIDQGTEKVIVYKEDPRLRRLSPTPEGGARPALGLILRQADEGGKVDWLRWETIDGVKTAVFSFAVDKKKALYGVDYCCFQTLGNVGYEWKPFKKIVGLHGEFFIDPDTGTTLRIILKAEFAPSDFVEQEDTRIDFGKVTVGGNNYLVPMGSSTHTEVDARGDSNSQYVKRRTMLVSSYANYRLADGARK
jgi:hypothetical protein